MNIPLWSETNPESKKILESLEKQSWGELSREEKQLIWKHLEVFLYNSQKTHTRHTYGRVETGYDFGVSGYAKEAKVKRFAFAVSALNDRYKRNSYARRFLDNPTFDNACADFYEIFISQNQDVVFELITLYCNIMVKQTHENLSQEQGESKSDFEKRAEEEKFSKFDSFSKEMNEVFEQFGLEYKLTRNGFIKVDEPRILETIYKPTLKKLSHRKWKPVNTDLANAFEDFNKHNGSAAITHALSALQAFLQITVEGKTGKGDAAVLIKKAQSQNLIPSSSFSSSVLPQLNSFFARERQDKGDAHPKNKSATDNEAKLVINLVIVFIDHVL